LDLGLAGRVALVTASSKGLGRALANGLATEGARVMISGRDEGSLEDTGGEIREATNAEVDHQWADLTRAEDIRALVERTAERFRGLDVLITNAGGPPAGTFDAVRDGDW
jgi:3-oxoacyl-[acyl-carrier protein] reductase